MARTFEADNNMPAAMGLVGEAVDYLRAENTSPRALFTAELVLEEMLTNMVKYAYDDAGLHRLGVTASVADNIVTLELADDGHAFDPTAAAPPPAGLPLAKQTVGGRGIHLVRNFVTDLDYRREGNWNLLRLHFPAHAPTAGAEA